MTMAQRFESATRVARVAGCVICLSCAWPAVASAQVSPQAGGRPRIGLALGGGSARGLAHIGVLEWFEANRIPIDLIAGTSMGGLIGGAYASGMTPAEIRELMRQTDWDLMFLSDSPYKYKTFRRKEDKRAFPSLLEFGLRGGLRLPSGLNPGQHVILMLDRIALPYYGLSSFDDLPTPYRAVATDLNAGEVVVLDRPPLARAMRATMAIPGVFTPVRWDDRLLVDGGALNNIPSDVARDMGADIVIAVDVRGSEAGEEAESLFSMLGRTIDTMMTANSRRSLAAADVVIAPPLKGFTGGSWRQSDGLADDGFAAAEGLADRLRPYALSPDAFRQFQAARQARRRREVPEPSRIEAQGLDATLSRATVREIDHEFASAVNTEIDPDDVASRILAVAGTDRYEYLTYSMAEGPAPESLRIGVQPKSYGPPFLMLGLDLSNVDSTNFAFNFSSRILTYDLLGKGSESRLDLVLGTTQRAAAEIVRPVFGKVFVAPRAYFDRRGRNLYVDDLFLAEYRIKRTGVGTDLGIEFGRQAELRIGLDTAAVRGRRRIGTPDLPEAEGRDGYATISFGLDTQTSPIVPTHGVRVKSSLRRYFSAPRPTEGAPESLHHDQNYTVGSVVGSWFRSVRGADRIFVSGEGGTSFGGEPLIATFTLGGPLRLGAFNNDELRGDNILFGAGGYLWQFGRMPDVLGGNVFLSGWLETGSVFDDWDSSTWRTSASLGVIVESLLGPVFAGVSLPVQSGAVRFYVSLGPLFR